MIEDDPIVEKFGGVPIVEKFGGVPIRRSQAMRAAEAAAALAEIRLRARYKSLPGAATTAGVSCARCEYCSDFSDEGNRGFCVLIRHMVSTWHACECTLFAARTTPKASDVLKSQLERQEAERRRD